MCTRIPIAFVLLAWWLPAGGVQAQPASHNPHLEEARRLYAGLQYARMVPVLEKALGVPGNTPGQLAEIHALLGTVHVILDNQQAAVEAFEQLLAIDPDHELDTDLSPKIRSLFARVKREFVPPVTVSFEGRPRVRTTPGTPPWVEVGVADESKAITGMELWYRRDEDGEFEKLDMGPVAEGRWGGSLPVETTGLPAAGLRVEYVIVARGEKGTTLGVLGSMEQPLSFTVLPALGAPAGPGTGSAPAALDEEQAAPWYASWWFWTAVGVVAAAGATTATVMLLERGGGEVPAGTLGTYTLR